MSKILVLSGHPDYKTSVANRAILDQFSRLVPDAEIVSLGDLYPNFEIDVKREQERILQADVVVMEFPIWWYSSPSLMHRYVEQVFTHGFAYGAQGKQLQGKRLILSFTSGAPSSAYSPEGYQFFTIDSLMPPFFAMANLTGMQWGGYVYSGSMMCIDPTDKAKLATIIAAANDHAARLAEKVK